MGPGVVISEAMVEVGVGMVGGALEEAVVMGRDVGLVRAELVGVNIVTWDFL